MDELIVKTYDTSLQNYELTWNQAILQDSDKKDIYRNPSLSLYTSMVYAFANRLPYSMDIEQPEYIPADFLNMMPYDVEENNWFKWEDRRTFFNSMIRWRDTFKTGMILQMCNVFQKMILGQFPSNFDLKEEDYSAWGINLMTDNEEYNRRFFETLKSLPDYYKEIISADNNEARRVVLDQMYTDIIHKIASRAGGFKEEDSKGNLIRESKGSALVMPSNDVKMLVYWENITFHDGIPSVIEAIKQEQFEKYISNKPQALKEASETPSSIKRL